MDDKKDVIEYEEITFGKKDKVIKKTKKATPNTETYNSIKRAEKLLKEYDL